MPNDLFDATTFSDRGQISIEPRSERKDWLLFSLQSATMGVDGHCDYFNSDTLYVCGLLHSAHVPKNMEEEGRQRRQRNRFTSSESVRIT